MLSCSIWRTFPSGFRKQYFNVALITELHDESKFKRSSYCNTLYYEQSAVFVRFDMLLTNMVVSYPKYG